MSNKTTISISTDTIIRTILILLAIAFLYVIKDVLALIFVAVVLSAAFDPLIDWLQARKFPRALSIIGVYLIFFLVVGGAIFLLAKPIGQEIKDISRAFPQYYKSINEGLTNLQNFGNSVTETTKNSPVSTTSLTDIAGSISQAGTSIFNALTSIFGGILSFFMVLLITFYLTVEEEGMKRLIQNMTPDRHKPYVAQLIVKIQRRMGYWLRGQLLLSVIVFVMVYIGLLIMNVKYALLLALLAGIFEVVPFLGPWISAIPGIFFAFSQGGLDKAFFVAVLYLVVQQIENNFIVPKVMGKTTGLNPLVVIIAILVGARLGGAIGALLAVPVTLALTVYFETFKEYKNQA